MECEWIRVSGGVRCERMGCENFLRVPDDYPLQRCHALCRAGTNGKPKRRKSPERHRDPSRDPCRYQGEPTGKMAQCRSCGGRIREFPLHSCDIYGECLPSGLEDGYHCCRICQDYETES